MSLGFRDAIGLYEVRTHNTKVNEHSMNTITYATFTVIHPIGMNPLYTLYHRPSVFAFVFAFVFALVFVFALA